MHTAALWILSGSGILCWLLAHRMPTGTLCSTHVACSMRRQHSMTMPRLCCRGLQTCMRAMQLRQMQPCRTSCSPTVRLPCHPPVTLHECLWHVHRTVTHQHTSSQHRCAPNSCTAGYRVSCQKGSCVCLGWIFTPNSPAQHWGKGC
jgi:hypothetical protein